MFKLLVLVALMQQVVSWETANILVSRNGHIIRGNYHTSQFIGIKSNKLHRGHYQILFGNALMDSPMVQCSVVCTLDKGNHSYVFHCIILNIKIAIYQFKWYICLLQQHAPR